MKTSLILYRVADFLRQYPPFQSVRIEELLPLARSGRVAFHAANEYVYKQGLAFRPYIWVIQQGSVEILDESSENVVIRDLLSAGDILGADRFSGAETYQTSARTTGDVIVYALDAGAFSELRERSPQIDRYLRALLHQRGSDQQGASWLPVSNLSESILGAHLVSVPDTAMLAATAEAMMRRNCQVCVVMGPDGSASGVVNDAVLRRALADGHTGDTPVAEVMRKQFPTASKSENLESLVLQMVRDQEPFVVIQDRGKVAGVVTETTVQLLNGISPSTLIRRVQHADSLEELALMRERVYAFVGSYLVDSSSVTWFAEFLSVFLKVTTARLIELCSREIEGLTGTEYCWMFFGQAGRGELMTATVPQGAIVSTEGQPESLKKLYASVQQAYIACGFHPSESNLPGVQPLASWKEKFRSLLESPLESAIHTHRELFDFQPAAGDPGIADELRVSVREALRSAQMAILLLGNDCLQSFPPLTLFQDAVVGIDGTRRDALDLSETALVPLADVGRYIALSAGDTFPIRTLARLEQGAQKESVLADAADAFRLLLLQQASSGIREQNDGSIVYPAVLGRYEQLLLKSAFRSVHKVLEYTYANAFSMPA